MYQFKIPTSAELARPWVKDRDTSYYSIVFLRPRVLLLLIICAGLRFSLPCSVGEFLLAGGNEEGHKKIGAGSTFPQEVAQYGH